MLGYLPDEWVRNKENLKWIDALFPDTGIRLSDSPKSLTPEEIAQKLRDMGEDILADKYEAGEYAPPGAE